MQFLRLSRTSCARSLWQGLIFPALADSPRASLWFAQHFGRRCKECTKLEIKTGPRECKSERECFKPTQSNGLTRRWSLSAWPLHKSEPMRQIMEKLLALQKLALDTKPLKLEHETEVLKWREKMPASILSHFDRLIARGKKGVAIARNGACGECHLRLPSGTMGALAYTNEVHLCDNCGRYLLSAGERAARPDRFAAADQSPRQITRQTNPAESGFACRLIPSSIPPL